MRCSIILLAALFIFAPKLHAQDVSGKWNGTITMEFWTESIVGTSHRSFDLVVTNNIVTGTMNGTGKKIIEGKLIAESTFFGEGTGQLWRVAFSSDGKTYDLEANSNSYNEHAVNLLTGQIIDQEVGGQGMEALEQPMPRNRSLLTGTIDTSGEVYGGIGKFRRYFRWTLYSGPLDAVLIVNPLKYDTWKPVPGMDELMKGEAMAVNLKVQGRNGGVSSLKAISFEITLNETSSEPGTTINYPINPTYNLPDLRLLPDPNLETPDPAQKMILQSSDGATGFFFIASYDGGGWTDLKVKAELEGGLKIDGHLFNPYGVITIPIPKRKPGSHIAESWAIENGNPGDMDDKELIRPNHNEGDGFTAYEEYRGIWHNATHSRLSAKKKELGVLVRKNEAGLFTRGMNLLKNAAGIEVLPFDSTEVAHDRTINYNYEYGHDDYQYALRLQLGDLPEGVSGKAYGSPNIPQNVDPVYIDTENVRGGYNYLHDVATVLHLPLPCTFEESLAAVVAHELAHGIFGTHHGPSGEDAPDSVALEGDPIRIIEYRNREITTRPYEIGKSVGNVGNQQSGDVNCIMAYNNFKEWVFKREGLYNCYYMIPAYCHGTIFCTSRVGTGINANQKFFEDTPVGRGSCIMDLRFK